MSITSVKNFFIRYFAVWAFLIAAVLTRPYYYADSYEYAHTIMDQEAGKSAPLFLESGHAIWRPIGLAAHYDLSLPIAKFLSLDIRGKSSDFAEVSAALIVVVFIFTIILIFYLYRLLRLFPLSERTIHATMLLYALSQCIIDYSHTGTSYMAGLSMLVIGLYYVIRNPYQEGLKNILLGGIILAIVPFLWLPYVLAFPAAFLARPMLYGWKRKNINASLAIIGIAMVTTILIFLPIAIHLNMTSPSDVSKWFFRSGQSSPTAGPQRTFFGLSKTLFYLGDQGLYVKRFLLHDPYNPVSALSLIKLGLWKVALFYCLLGTSFVTIWRDRAARKYIPFLLAGFIPTIALSLAWDGSALERHIPLLPFMFIGFALMIENGSRSVKYLFVMTAIATAIVNLSGMWYATLGRDENNVCGKIAEIWPRLNDHSFIAVISGHDEIAKFQGINPFNLYNQSPRLQTYPLVAMGYDSARLWREKFESASKQSWSGGGDVWVTRTILAPAPASDMYWIEGADPVSWRQVSGYFRGLRYSDSTKDFLLLDRESFALIPDLNAIHHQ